MSLTLSVTSSSTLFATNIASNATSLTFTVSPDGGTYSTLATVPSSPITIPVGTTSYSLTVTLIPTYYYRVTDGLSTSAAVQYILPTKGATGSSTSSFSNAAGSNTVITPTSVTFSTTGTNTVTSDQTYPVTQGVYFQATLPVLTSNSDSYEVFLYDSAQSNYSNSISFFVSRTAGVTSYIIRRRDGSVTPVTLVTSTTFSSPINVSFYWDGTSIAYAYVGGVLATSYSFVTSWTGVKAAIVGTTITSSGITVSGIGMYQSSAVPTAQTWRLRIQNVTGTSLTSSTSPAISTTTYGTYYNITNSGFNALTLPAAPSSVDSGAFWVLRNNTSSYLSVTVTNPNTLSNPLVIPPANSVTIVWNGSAYILF